LVAFTSQRVVWAYIVMPFADHRWLTSFHPASHTSFASHVAQARNEVCHTLLQRRAHSSALLSGRVSDVAATPPKRRWSAGGASSTARRSCWRSWVETISALVARAAAFKRCCLNSGRYDGRRRDDYF